MELVIARHGQTEYTLKGIYEGSYSRNSLAEEGGKYADDLGRFLRDKGIEVIYSSPLTRGMETARHIALLIKSDIISEPLLGEMSYGSWEERKKSELVKTKKWAERAKNKYRFVHPGKNPAGAKGESYKQMETRVIPFFKRIIKNAAHKKVLVVTHIGILRAVGRFFGKLSEEESANFLPSFKELYVLKVSGKRVVARIVAFR